MSYLLYQTGKVFCYSTEDYVKRLQEVIENKYSMKSYIARKSLWLRQMGVTYMMGRDLSVYRFILIRFALALLMCVAGLGIAKDMNRIIACVLVVILTYLGSVLPVFFLKISNDMDNGLMLEDIRVIYDTLKIQSKSGVFITEILSECYLLVSNPRLKNALRELANEIYTKHDLRAGLHMFNSKFKNSYIDMMVLTIEQSVQSGQTVKMFQDVAQQIQQVEQALYQKEKKRAENRMLAYQLAVYFAILMIVVYAMFSQLIKAFSF